MAEEPIEEKQIATPGPWEWRSFGGPLMLMSVRPGKYVVLQAARKGMQSAEFLMRDDRIVMRPMTRDHPDARLIAAAPELLAALEAILRPQTMSLLPSHAFTQYPEFAAAYSQAIDAVAKAKGDTAEI